MSRFRLSPGGRRPHEPWFHIGSLEVGTTWLVVLLGIAGIAVGAATGFSSESEWQIALDPAAVIHQHYVWAVLTWPLSYYFSFGLSSIFALVIFWYFGAELERDLLGRSRFAWLLGSWVLALSAIALILYSAFGWDSTLAAMPLLSLMTMLLWIAEWPHRMFLFNIPAWLIGVVVVALEIVSIIGYRAPGTNWRVAFLDFVLGVVLCAFIARQFGMLGEYPWIPRLIGNRPRRTRLRSVRTAPPVAPRPAQPVAGPWTPPVSQADEDRMNQLLEKIHEHGAESLTERERSELNELRLRRRQGH